MMNTMTIGGQRVVIRFDPEIGMFRGKFVGLSGDADFYADSVTGLQREGETSLRVFLDMCAGRESTWCGVTRESSKSG
nr:type II toxin-antitoxin system HicB family antitoxin [Gluconacetobacter tumulisoli]